MKLATAIEKIEERGALLVFPIDNKKEPASIWSAFYPKSEMRWEWDDGGDHRVANLWHLRTELSESGKVVYTKWFRGRATFFSKEVYVSVLRRLGGVAGLMRGLSDDGQTILECLLSESPLSTKELKRKIKLEGRYNEKNYERAMKDLWMRGLIVGVGEVDDGAFPSLAIGASEVMFEDLVRQAGTLSLEKANGVLQKYLAGTLFLKELDKIEKKIGVSCRKPMARTISGEELSISSKSRYNP